jgi:hypothetical protein
MSRSFDLLQQLWPRELSGFNQLDFILVAFLINLFETGIFALPGFVFPTNRLLAASYYKVKNPQRLTRLYRLLGVKYFKNGLLFLYWGHRKQRKKYFNGTRSGIDNLIYQTKQSEFGHLGALILINLSGLALLSRGHWQIFIYITVLNILGNGYPILIQRHHRLRVAKLRQRPLVAFATADPTVENSKANAD